MKTILVKRSSTIEKYPIDTYTIAQEGSAPDITCTVNHVTGKVKVAAWSGYYGTYITKTTLGPEPEGLTIEDSLFIIRQRSK